MCMLIVLIDCTALSGTPGSPSSFNSSDTVIRAAVDPTNYYMHYGLSDYSQRGAIIFGSGISREECYSCSALLLTVASFNMMQYIRVFILYARLSKGSKPFWQGASVNLGWGRICKVIEASALPEHSFEWILFLCT
eukprot:jgi/Botrbrau1/149/Bobra.0022s0134.1